MIQASFMEFSTYFINENHGLKVISISGGDSLKTLAEGSINTKPIGSFELFRNGVRVANSYGDFNSHGQDSWVNNQRSLDFIARDEYGYSAALKDKIFDLSDRNEFQRLILRAAGDDNYPDGSNTAGGGAHLRDAYIQNLVKIGKLNLDVRTSEKAIVYLNGKYWGVYDIRERPDDSDYTNYNYNQDKYNTQMIQTWGNTWAKYGGYDALDDWDDLTDLVEKNDLKIQSNFNKISELLDVKSLTDYVITNSITVCTDWLNYNTGWWRGLDPKGGHKKWGYMLWDNDATFGYYLNYTGIPDTSTNAKPCDVEVLKDSILFVIPGFITQDTIIFNGVIYFLPGDTIASYSYKEIVDLNKHMLILDKLRQNKEFNQYYITRYADLMNTIFSKQNMLSYLESQYNLIKPEMARHINRWGGTMAEWEDNVNKLKNFIDLRSTALNKEMRDCYNLTGPHSVTYQVKPDTGTLIINSQTITKFPYTSNYFGGISTNVEAKGDPTIYDFDKWTANQHTSSSNTKSAKNQFYFTKNDTVTAFFVKKTTSAKDLGKDILTPNIAVFPTVFDQTLYLGYDLPTKSKVSIAIYNTSGALITIVTEKLEESSGHYDIKLDFSNQNIPSGLYLLTFEANQFKKTVKIVKK